MADFALGEQIYGPIRSALENRDIGILVNNVGVISEYPKYLTEVRPEEKNPEIWVSFPPFI